MIGFFKRTKHSKTLSLLSAYIDGQVTDAEAREVEGHLSRCEECCLEHESLRAIVDLVRDLPQLTIPRSFTLTEAPEQVRARPPIVWTTGIATSMAAILLVALLLGEVVGIFTQSRAIDNAAFIQQVVSAPEAAVVVEMQVIVEKEAVTESEAQVEVARAVQESAEVERTTVVEKQVVKAVAVEKEVEQEVVKESQPAIAMAAPAAATPESEEAPKEALSVTAAPQQATTPTPGSVATVSAGAKASDDEEPSEDTASIMDVTPESLPTQVSVASSTEEEASPVPEVARVVESEEAVPTPEQAAIAAVPTLETPDSGDVRDTLSESPEGLTLPLRQLQVAVGLLVAILVLATLWTVRRSGGPYR